MAKFEARKLILSSYYAVVRRAFNRKARPNYGREKLYTSLWADAAKDIGAEIVSTGENYFRITKAGRSTTVQFHYVNSDTYFNQMMVDQKPRVSSILQQFGYPTPRYVEFDPYTLDLAREFLAGLETSAVVKPRRGSGGGGVTTGVNSEDRLWKASVAASANWSHKMMIEEQCGGESYRLLFLDGELIDALRRGRPTVVGDGKRSIKQLIALENTLREQGTSCRSLGGLSTDLDSEFWLQDNGMSLTFVPDEGQRVIVKSVANQNSIEDNATVLADVHSDYKRVGKHLCEALGFKLVGIDLMAADISLSIEEGECSINEINIPPGLHYHELVNNIAARAGVGARILESILMGPATALSSPAGNHEWQCMK